MGREIEGRMWEFQSCTGKPLIVSDDEVREAYKALFPDSARLLADKARLTDRIEKLEEELHAVRTSEDDRRECGNRASVELRTIREDKEHYHKGLLLAHGELHIDGRTTNLGPVQCEYCLAAHEAIHAELGWRLRAATEREAQQ